MASVDSKTSFKIDQLINDTIIDGRVVNGHLLLINRWGAEIDAGRVGEIGATNFKELHAHLSLSMTGAVPALFLGSSTTHGISASMPDRCYVSLLARAMQSHYSSGIAMWEPPVVDLANVTFAPNLPGIHPVNGGLSSTFSNSYCPSGVLAKIAILQPRVVFHMPAANDYRTGLFTPAQTAANVLENIANIDALLTIPCQHVLLGTYASPDTLTPAYPWADYMRALESLAANNPRVIFADPSPAFIEAGASGPGAADPLDLIDTGLVHTTDAGHAVLATEIARLCDFGRLAELGRYDVADRMRRKVLGSAETGQVYEQQSGVHVPNGTYMTVTTAGNVVVDTGFSDAEISAIFTHSAGAVYGTIGKSTDANTRVGFYFNGPSSRWELYLGTSILTWSTAVTLTADREYHLRLEVKNDLVRGYADGKHVLSSTLTAPQAATYNGYTKHGLRFNSTTGAPKARAFSVRAI